MARDRRTFLKTAGVAAAVGAAGPLGVIVGDATPGGTSRASAAPAPGRGPAAGRFALELGDSLDMLQLYSGGFPYGEVAEFTLGTDPIPDKIISGVGCEDIVVQVGAAPSPALREWIAAMIGGEPMARTGAIVMADNAYQVRARLEFHNALIREVEFPAADASAKDPAFLTVVIAPETTEYKPSSGALPAPSGKQKLWQASNFRFSMGSLPTSRTAKIESFSVKQAITEYREGGSRFSSKIPGKLEYPNLVPTLSATDGGPWFDYFKQSVLDGVAVPEKSGKLEWLAPDLQSVLIGIEFHNLGIFRCALEKLEGASDQLSRITAGLYMEGMTLLPAVQ